ncbi:MAG: cytochrome c [Rhodocyclales bacterium]|nr:cytochrome c [Rhodocyclales bacterium]
MNKSVKSILAAMIVVASAGALAQQGQPKPENLIKWRQSAYQVLAWNSGRLKANVDGQYNKDEVVKAANTIAAIANSGLGALFAAGTEQGKGWHDTSTKPEFFKDAHRVGELAGNFNKEANELAKVAVAGDAAAVKEQFGKLGKSCKACHDDFKIKD